MGTSPVVDKLAIAHSGGSLDLSVLHWARGAASCDTLDTGSTENDRHLVLKAHGDLVYLVSLLSDNLTNFFVTRRILPRTQVIGIF